MDYTKQRTALITGGNKGLGLELARYLAGFRYALILVGRSATDLDSSAQVCLAAGAYSVETIALDITVRDNREKLREKVNTICANTGCPLEIVVNNAGRGLFGPISNQSVEDITSLIQLNIEALTHLSCLWVPELSASGGKILNVGSVVGYAPSPYFAVYSASKSYVHTFSLSVREELKEQGIGVTLLEPGFIRTGFDDTAGINSATYKTFSYKNGLDPDVVARKGVNALFRGKAVAIPGLANKISSILSTILPPVLLTKLLKASIKSMTRRQKAV